MGNKNKRKNNKSGKNHFNKKICHWFSCFLLQFEDYLSHHKVPIIILLLLVLLSCFIIPYLVFLQIHQQELQERNSQDAKFVRLIVNRLKYYQSHPDATKTIFSPTQIQTRLNLLLKSKDLNHDTVLDADELRSWILESHSVLVEHESLDEFLVLDVNTNGFISWDEVLIDTFQAKTTMGNDDDDPKQQVITYNKKALKTGYYKACFLHTDLNHDNQLSIREFLSCSHPEVGNTHIAKALYKSLYESINLVAFSESSQLLLTSSTLQSSEERWEFLEDLRKNYGSNSEQFNSIFNIYKRLESNLIDDCDERNLSFPSIKEGVAAIVSLLLKTLDLNSDGRLSLTTEFPTNPDFFISSELTRFGLDLFDYGTLDDKNIEAIVKIQVLFEKETIF